MKKEILTIVLLTVITALFLSGCTDEATSEKASTTKQVEARKKLYSNDADSYFEKKPKPVTSNNF